MTMMQRTLLWVLLLASVSCVYGQATDKADADALVFKQLTSGYDTDNWHAELAISESRLEKTAEEGIWLVRGDTFQIASLCSDFYVSREHGQWSVIDDARYPMETAANLLLNRISDNRRQLELTHHQYGGLTPHVVMPMQNLYDLLARHMELYCTVTKVTAAEMQATVVLFHRNLNFIHLLIVKCQTSQITDKTGIITADLYTNIPQGNIKTLFKERQE